MNRNVTATILLVLAIAIYFTVTESFYAGVKAQQAVNQGYITALSNADELIKLRDSVLRNYNNISEDDRAKLDKILPTSVNNIHLVVDMSSIATKHGFQLSNVKVSIPNTATQVAAPVQTTSTSGTTAISTTPISPPTLATIQVDFSAKASYQQFLDFLKDVESSLRILDVTHLIVKSNDNGVYDFTVTLKTYSVQTK